MSYMALYRKYRPVFFRDVIGQDPIVQTLKNQIQQNRLAHAYLFCGTRGTGKTSTAKIFAKVINCLQPKDGEPCNECSMCRQISEGSGFNVLEIDAASNNGVDNIREIREEIRYTPTEGTFKVYIIDEVHMLSIGAFNALLKSLEEPPAHVIFILATTDPQKVPPTIHSRCQRFDFRRIPAEAMVQQIKSYMAEESIDIEEEALRYIASLTDGAMRDALSILDQCVSFHFGETITLEKVMDIVGAVDPEIFYRLTEALSKQNAVRCMEVVGGIIAGGRDIKQFSEEYVWHLRNLLITIEMEHPETVLNVSGETLKKLQALGKNTSPEKIRMAIQTFAELESQMKYAGNPRVLLEITLLKMCEGMYPDGIDGIAVRLGELEKKLSNGITITPPQPEPEKKNKK